MAMTAAVKDELSRVTITRMSARKAEIATMLRFAGALHLIGGHIVIEAELDTGSVARRLRKEIGDVFGHTSQVHVVAAGGLRKSSRFLVRVTKDGEGLARQAGLVDLRGRPVRGLPQHVVAGGVADAEAAWRGAFLAHGSLTEPGRAGSLEITCPSGEAALALVGTGRRLGISAKAREVRGADRVVIRDGDAIGALLTRLGRARHGAGLGGEADASRGPGHRQPAGQLRRRQPAPFRPGRRRRRGPGRTRDGHPGRHDPRSPAAGRAAAHRAQAGVAGGTGRAVRPADDQGTPSPAVSAACWPWPTSARSSSASPTPRPPSPADMLAGDE